MQTCLLRRASIGNESGKTAACRTSSTRVNASANRWLAISAMLLGWVGWRALRDLLDAIPDSNDDFGLF
ncbi:hypothetical protein LMG28614_05879 [Paraburkholderia ultramafica]|uniref:Uncharacterized protein n=1 Tax=Paraburkholderia ultramafica TaxID=1544867 RepID=A0A6S7BKM3_9BURK|nr:hypothetical protein [Paraburkholderia ultramafica]CAB3803747.1 hypothetical protein LMG28614_05879 [Paraburkholderia ultramafica]